MYVTVYCSYAYCRNKFAFIFDWEPTIFYSLLGSLENLLDSSNLCASYIFVSLNSVLCMQKIIHSLITNSYERNFHCEKTKKLYILPPVQHSSRLLHRFDQSKICTGYMWIMCATFVACFKFLTLLVFHISGTQKSGNFIYLNRIPERYIC